MLSRLHVENFRSLKDLTLEFPQPLMVLVGPNNSGKSNILEAIGFFRPLKDRKIGQLFSSRGGYRKVVFGGKELEAISFNFKMNLNEKNIEYQGIFERARIIEEKLTIDKKRFFKGKDGNGSCWDELEKDDRTFSLGMNGPALFQLTDLRRHQTLIQIANYISGFRIYDFVPSKMRRFHEVKHDMDPGRHGEALPVALHTIMSSDFDSFSQIREVIVDAITAVEDLKSPLTDDSRTYIALREAPFDKPFDSEQLSAGTLKFLAILSVLYSPEPPSLICLEEPENHIHPWLLEMLVELIMKSGHQVIISTHSPELVSYVPLESLVIVEKEKGVTSAKSVEDVETLRESMERAGMKPGKLWLMGELGGVPE